MTEVCAPSERIYRILLVDDERLLCRAISRIMSNQKLFEFRALVSAQEAPQVFVDEGPFDVLLTDLHFPDGKGVALAEALQRLQPSLKVIFMSGDIPAGFAGQCLTLQKPFERGGLIRILEKALGLNRI
jgi:DNA-binding NtrC family response regulator